MDFGAGQFCQMSVHFLELTDGLVEYAAAELAQGRFTFHYKQDQGNGNGTMPYRSRLLSSQPAAHGNYQRLHSRLPCSLAGLIPDAPVFCGIQVFRHLPAVGQQFRRCLAG